jgi:hypothetical protein
MDLLVGDQGSSSSHSKQAVHHHHVRIISRVSAAGDVLMVHYKDAAVWFGLQSTPQNAATWFLA